MRTTASLPCGCKLPVDEKGRIKHIDFSVDRMNLNCPLVWQMMAKGLNKGVFQLESNLGHKWVKELKPESIDHLSGLGATLRPGCLNNLDDEGISVTSHYCLRKNGLEPVVSYHDSLDKILEETFSLLIYQEQALKIAVELAGFSGTEADTLRRGIGKKSAEIISQMEKLFLEKAKPHGVITEEQAKEIFGWIKKSTRYSFNKSHSCSYAILGYFTAYAKAHAPLQFFCSYLREAKEKVKPQIEIRELVAEAKLMDIFVKGPTILDNKKAFYIKNGEIYYGLCNIKGIGEATYSKIQSLIDIKAGDSWWTTINKLYNITTYSIIEKMILAGALDFTKVSRNRMLFESEQLFDLYDKVKDIKPYENYGSLIECVEAYVKHFEKEVSENLTKAGEEKKNIRKKLDYIVGLGKIVKNPPMSLNDIPAWIAYNETVLLGTAISCSKLDGCDIGDANATLKEFIDGRNDFMLFAVEIEKVKQTLTKKDARPMAFLTVKDNSCSLSDVCIFPDTYEACAEYLTEGNTVLLHGEKSKKNGSMTVKNVLQL